MNQIHTSRFFKKLRLRRRAVVRTIDFLISFTLFIILLTQFYLIIINMNLNLASTSTQTNNPAQLFTDNLLSYTGTKGWGTASGLPANIGLASDYEHSTTGYYIDLAKLGRLNQELTTLSINGKYPYLNPNYILSNFTNNQNNIGFRLTTRPPLQITASAVITTTTSTITINTLTWDNNSVSNVAVDVYHVSLSTGIPLPKVNATSNVAGTCVVTTNIIRVNYVAIIFAHSGDSWGISWLPIRNSNTNLINSTGIASFSLNNPKTGSNSILEFANNTINSQQIRATSSYYINNNDTLYVNSTPQPSGIRYLNQTFTNVGTSGPFIQVYSTTIGTTDYYRVVTEPLIFDNVNYTNPSLTNYSSSQYPTYQTSNFSTVTASSLYAYSTIVITDRGPLLFSLELSET